MTSTISLLAFKVVRLPLLFSSILALSLYLSIFYHASDAFVYCMTSIWINSHVQRCILNYWRIKGCRWYGVRVRERACQLLLLMRWHILQVSDMYGMHECWRCICITFAFDVAYEIDWFSPFIWASDQKHQVGMARARTLTYSCEKFLQNISI